MLVRLVCKGWAEVGTEYLFEHIYFASRPESIRRFENIIGHRHLAECVKHLVFDDTQLPKRLLREESHSSALANNRLWSRCEQVAAHDAFFQHYHHQEQIKASSKDLTVLLEGIPRLTKMKKVSVIGGPSHLSRLRIPAGPHTGDLADAEVAASYWSYHKQNKAYYEPWDGLRVQHLFGALSSPKIRFTELHIGNWQEYPTPLKMGLPLSSLMAPNSIEQANFTTNAQTVFSRLTELNLQIDLNPRVKGHDYSERYYETLFQILSSMTRLKRLTFGVTQWSVVFDVHHTKRLLNNTWHDLVAIKLRCMRVDPDTLLDFLARHKATLTTLYLQHVGFEPDSRHTWLDVAQRGGQFLRLDYAELDVYEWGADSDTSGCPSNSTSTDLAVILAGGYPAMPPSGEAGDSHRVMKPSFPMKARETHRGFGFQNNVCDRCGRWLMSNAQAQMIDSH